MLNPTWPFSSKWGTLSWLEWKGVRLDGLGRVWGWAIWLTKIPKYIILNSDMLSWSWFGYGHWSFIHLYSKLLNPKPGPVQTAPPLSIQANSKYLILRRLAGLGWALLSARSTLFSTTALHCTALLRLAIYSGANTKIALTEPPSEISTPNFLGYVDRTLS